MYKFTVNGETFKANWKYTWEQEVVKKVVRTFSDTHITEKTIKKFQNTRCNIYDDKGGFVSDGYSILNRKDLFDKKIGRKLSFHRALENAGFTKDERTEVMNAYFNSF